MIAIHHSLQVEVEAENERRNDTSVWEVFEEMQASPAHNVQRDENKLIP